MSVGFLLYHNYSYLAGLSLHGLADAGLRAVTRYRLADSISVRDPSSGCSSIDLHSLYANQLYGWERNQL